MELDERIKAALDGLKSINRFRALTTTENLIDFSSNDYLGLAKNSIFHVAGKPLGSTGSRLISGNSQAHQDLETAFAHFFETEAALLFGNGYLANVGLISSVINRNDIIIYDQFIHASIRDGISLSKAANFGFKHNDLADLEKKINHALTLKTATNQLFLLIESVYSMDGDSPDIAAIVALCEQHQIAIIVDEAHGFGTIGAKGEGLVQHLKLEPYVWARVVTFGKALGCEGAVVVGSADLINYLINTCRTFIYNTALSPQTLAAITHQFDAFKGLMSTQKIAPQLKKQLQENLQSEFTLLTGDYGTIVMIVTPGNAIAKAYATHLQNNGIDVRAILSPTVPEGTERLRICLHEYNTEAEVALLSQLLIAFKKQQTQ